MREIYDNLKRSFFQMNMRVKFQYIQIFVYEGISKFDSFSSISHWLIDNLVKNKNASNFKFEYAASQLWMDRNCMGGILFTPEKAVEEVSHVVKTAF